MSWYFIPPLLGALGVLIIGAFVYFRNKTSIINKTFSLFCFLLFTWLISYAFAYLTKSQALASMLCRIACTAVNFLFPTLYLFIAAYLNKIKEEKFWIFAFYTIMILSLPFFLFSKLFLDEPHRYYWGYYSKAGPLHPYYLIITAAIWIKTLFLFFDKKMWARFSYIEKNKTKYIFILYVISSLGCLDYIQKYGVEIYPLGWLSAILFTTVAAYAILRHQLMDIRVVIKKTLIFGGLFTVVYAVFAFFAFLGQMFFERFVTANRWIAMMPSVLVVTIMLRPLENFLVNITDRYLFQKKYDYKKLLKTFTSEVLTILDLNKLIKTTEGRLAEIMKLKSCNVVLGEKMGQSQSILDSRFRGNDIMDSRFRGNDREDGTVPIFSRDNKIIGALVLGRKKSDEDYTQEDLDILNPLAKALGIAISNAKLFGELVKARAEMAQKDKMATIGTLAAGMAHEIRNPITTIRNFADYLPERYGDKSFVDKFDKLIPREIDRIESIARSLLEFSSAGDTVRNEEFFIDEPIKTVIALLEPQYRASEIKIICDFSRRHIIKGSRTRLQDAFFNIMSYMMAETPKGGSIVIECAAEGEKLKIYIRSRLLVMADHIIKDVFEPVSGLYKEKRGFGFNIFVAKQLIENAGGELTVSSGKSAGSEFCIRF